MVRNRRNGIIAVILLCLFAAGIVFYRIINSRTFQFFGEIISNVETHEKVIALTLDDGPTVHTAQVLAVLRELNVHATFFVNGYALENNIAYGQMIVQAGHELGNHSFSHKRMIFTTPHVVKDEVEKTDSLIVRAGYTGPIYFRPPYGKKFLLLPYYLYKHKRKTIMWDIAPESAAPHGDANAIAAAAIRAVKPGSVILLHTMFENRQGSLDAVKHIVKGLQAKGYRFVTVSELLALSK